MRRRIPACLGLAHQGQCLVDELQMEILGHHGPSRSRQASHGKEHFTLAGLQVGL